MIITANDVSRYFDATAFTGGNGVTITGLVNGDAIGSLSGAPIYGGSAQGAIVAGAYEISASGLANPNYDITWRPGLLTIRRSVFTAWPSLTLPTPIALPELPSVDLTLPALAGAPVNRIVCSGEKANVTCVPN